MIDEIKLIEKIKKRLNELEKEYTYYQRTNAEMMDIYEQGMFELENVLRWMAELKSERGEWIKIQYVKEESPDGGFWIYSCSNCYTPNYKNSTYCPHCGIRMERE